MRISPVEVSLAIVVGKDRRVDIEPVALIPNQRLAQGILERTVGRIGFEYGDTVSVEWGIEVILAVALYRLDGPRAVLTTAPGDILQGGHGPVLRPVHHIGGRPKKPVVHKEACRALLVQIGDVLGGRIVRGKEEQTIAYDQWRGIGSIFRLKER